LGTLTKRKLSVDLPPDASLVSDKQDLSVYTCLFFETGTKGN